MLAEFQFTIQQTIDQCFQRYSFLPELSCDIGIFVFENLERRNSFIRDRIFVLIRHFFGHCAKKPTTSYIRFFIPVLPDFGLFV